MESWFGLYGNPLIIELCVNLIATGLVQSIPLYITLPPKNTKFSLDVSKNRGILKWMVYNEKPLLKWMIWGVKTHIFGETPLVFPERPT